MWLALSAALAALAVAAVSAGRPPPSASAHWEVTVAVGDNWFCDPSFVSGVCETTVDAGSTVVWDYASGMTLHTSTDCGDSLDVCNPADRLWHSGSLVVGDKYSFEFDTPGRYLYRCQVHPLEMRGRVVVGDAIHPLPQASP